MWQPVSGGGRFAAGGDAEFAEDVGHVHAGGLGRDEQLGRDLAVAAPGREQPQYLQLAPGQPERDGRGGVAVAGELDTRAARQPADLLQQRAGAELAGEFCGSLQPGSRGVAVSRCLAAAAAAAARSSA